MQIAHLHKHRSTPCSRHIEYARSINRDTFDLSGDVSFGQIDVFVQRFCRNRFSGNVYLRVQRSFCFAKCGRRRQSTAANRAIEIDGESLGVDMRRIDVQNMDLFLVAQDEVAKNEVLIGVRSLRVNFGPAVSGGQLQFVDPHVTRTAWI